jgi:hypothetical protein
MLERRVMGPRPRIGLLASRQNANPPHLFDWLGRYGTRQDHRRAAEQRDELASPHSITFVGAGEPRRRHGEVERLRGGQVHNQIEFGRLLDWKVGRLCPACTAFLDFYVFMPGQLGAFSATR